MRCGGNFMGICSTITCRWIAQSLVMLSLGLGNGWVPSGNEPSFEPVLTKIHDAATMSKQIAGRVGSDATTK